MPPFAKPARVKALLPTDLNVPVAMAMDLASTPSTGLRVQCGGDSHLVNFRGLATPERQVIFAINDPDETLPAPWEWDLKRLAASFVIACRDGTIASSGIVLSLSQSAIRIGKGTFMNQTSWERGFTIVLFCLLFAGSQLFAQSSDSPQSTTTTQSATPPAGANPDALRKAAQNPIASLISVPVQNNLNFNVNPDSRTQSVLNIQPVIPIKLNSSTNLIVRWITPIIWQPFPSSTPGTEVGTYGLGDMQPTFFFSPSKASKLIWGAGPIFQLPTATDKALGQGKFGIGPSFVWLVQPGKWTVGSLVNNVFSVAGPSDRADVNQMTLQYFINYNLKKGWYIGTMPIVTANWEAPNSQRWVVPAGGTLGRVMRLGPQPVNLQLGFYANPIRPANSSSWKMLMQIVFMYPKRK
jgi:hypothetical protein